MIGLAFLLLVSGSAATVMAAMVESKALACIALMLFILSVPPAVWGIE